MTAVWYVYWLRDDTCRDIETDGCVGATKATRLYQRLNQHQKSPRFPKDFDYEIIFRGPRTDALALEAKLRPTPRIGWNIGIGGFGDGRGLKGIPKSPEQREKIRLAALARYAKPGEKERTAKSVTKALQGIHRKNGMLGRHHSEATKQKIRERLAERGGVSGKRNPNYRHGNYVD